MQTDATRRHEREGRLLDGVRAFARRDLDPFGRAMRPDVEMRLPGTSWLAGVYRGPEAVTRCIVGLRDVLQSSADRVRFRHTDDQVVMEHEVTLRGRFHEVTMTFSVTVTYDDDEHVRTIAVEPADLGLFDHVLKTSLVASQVARHH
jgi:ketosteroid isomerase-like protein